MRKATLDKSGVYKKGRAEFTAEYTAIAASYIVRPVWKFAVFVYQISAVHARNIRTYRERLSEGILTELE